MTLPSHERVLPSGFHDLSEQVLQNEAPDAGAGVEGGQDEERLEHDGEVIPKREHPLARDDLGKHVSHAHGESRRAAGLADERRSRRGRWRVAAFPPW